MGKNKGRTKRPNLILQRRKEKKKAKRRKNDDNDNKTICHLCGDPASERNTQKDKTCKHCRPKCTGCQDNVCDSRIHQKANEYCREFCYNCRPKCVECHTTPKDLMNPSKLDYWKCRECMNQNYNWVEHRQIKN